MSRRLTSRTIALIALLSGTDTALAQELIREHLGPVSGGAFGTAIAPLPDLDGDGVTEYAVSDPGGGFHTGTVDVFSGGTGATLFTIQGSGTGTFGVAIGDAGDVDGDGISDLLVGDPSFDDPNQTFMMEGAVRTYSGKDGTLMREWFGSGDSSRAGNIVASLDDVDGDGVPDMLVSEGSTWTNPPKAVAISGNSDAVLYEVVDEYGVTIRAGDFVIGSDRDGDGLRDILILDRCTLLYSCSGASGAAIDWENTHSGCGSGQGGHAHVAEVGDLDGDGKREFLVSINPGAFGGCYRGILELLSFESGIWGSRSSNGYWVDVLPDSDGDGVDDYVASDKDACESGLTVFSGRSGETLFQGGATAFSWNESRPVRSVGDLDGDGLSDFIRAASGFTDTGGVQRGIVRVYSGNDLWLSIDNPDPYPFEGVTLTTRGVPSGNLVGLAAVEFNGTPIFAWIGFGPADATEALIVSGTVPWGLTGNTATFQSFAIGRSGRVIDSAKATIVFQ